MICPSVTQYWSRLVQKPIRKPWEFFILEQSQAAELHPPLTAATCIPTSTEQLFSLSTHKPHII
uniref:Uncharacterized protein n=1 Tax=Rhizophora mucronata TaxID=61149 RepID=A0A2P2JVA1_RHIMU